MDAPIASIVASSANHTLLLAAATQANLVDTLSGPGPLTLFAPTDAAFLALNETTGGYLDTLLSDPFVPHLTDVLQYHVVEGSFLSTDLEAGSLEMLSGEVADISLDMGGVMINDEAAVTAANNEASNGVVHVTDGVLTPSWIDTSVVDLALSDPDNFSILVDLLTTAELADTLAGPGPFTVFAPTNDAFAVALEELGGITLEELKSDAEREHLIEILQYHVVSGSIVTSDMLAGGMTLEMLNMESAMVPAAQTSGGITIAGAPIVQTDFLVNNGVVHVVSAVMLPEHEHDHDDHDHDDHDHDDHGDEDHDSDVMEPSSAFAAFSTTTYVALFVTMAALWLA